MLNWRNQPLYISYPVPMQISPQETKLVGSWENIGGKIRADAVAARIEELRNTYLTKIAVAESGWETVYRDPTDLRLWELTYPQGEMHGGGPPMLRCLSTGEAQAKYKF
jgi:immunity protein 27 of polymorphic toxin system